MSTRFEETLRTALHEERPPLELTVDTAEVVREGESVRRRGRRLRQAGIAVGTAAAVAVAVPVVSSIRSDTPPSRAGTQPGIAAPSTPGGSRTPIVDGMNMQGATVRTADGGTARLALDTVAESYPPQLSLSLTPTAQGAGAKQTTTVTPSQKDGGVTVGRFGDQTFYLVSGTPGVDTRAAVVSGPGRPTVPAQQVRVGTYTVIWPDQAAAKRAATPAVGVLWRTVTGEQAATLPTRRTADAPRLLVVPRPDGKGSALLSTDTRTLQLNTVAHQVATAVTPPVTAVPASGAGLGRLVVGLVPVAGIAPDGFGVTAKVAGRAVTPEVQRERTGLFAATVPAVGVSAASGEPLPRVPAVDVTVSAGGATRTVAVPGQAEVPVG
ncbi:hypothetical protein [Luteipulveratus flavus]|uniref:Uncharacterized protein n=1 Tax=Luteipulveratus flavus TaxID=3031728 RepID=A0ABT6CCD6_9MICO|nr:hypothetical protein [Luteipulveratus sp. YIM 133296]MDF8266173.1 hypothetical protein [Luteipulveratus sp. YIM 133296]